MTKDFLLVGLGGLLGSVLRFYVYKLAGQVAQTWFPLGTFTVNVVGSLLIGVLYAVAERHSGVAETLRPLLMTGFCGGFTTFSALSLENYLLLRSGDYLAFAGYTLLSILTGFIAVLLGIRIGSSLTW